MTVIYEIWGFVDVENLVFQGFEDLICALWFWGFEDFADWWFEVRIYEDLKGFWDCKDLVVWRFSGFLGFANLRLIGSFGDFKDLVIWGVLGFHDLSIRGFWFDVVRIWRFEDFDGLNIWRIWEFRRIEGFGDSKDSGIFQDF